MRGKLDQRGLLEQELQKIWATKSLSLMLILDGVWGFPGGTFQECCVSCLCERPSHSSIDELL